MLLSVVLLLVSLVVASLKMFSPDSRSMTHLVNQLKRSGSIQSRIVEEVMLKVDRGFNVNNNE